MPEQGSDGTGRVRVPEGGTDHADDRSREHRTHVRRGSRKGKFVDASKS